MVSFSRNMARSKVQPTHYPRLPFHFLRSAQLLSSIVVAAVMFFFIDQLHRDGYPLPWTFLTVRACRVPQRVTLLTVSLQLLVVSFLTILFLSATIVLHCCCGLNPRLNVFLNSGLLVLWTVGFALLTWWSSGTLGHVCNTANWRNEDGIMVCRIYKALFAFAMLGFMSTLAALLLDIYVFKRATARGKYGQMMDVDMKRSGPGLQQDPSAVNLDEPHVEQRPFGVQRSRKAPEQTGYALPEEQFAYDDTGYYGAHNHGVNRRHEEALM
ncbi:hypothetical protein UCRNP2_6076 [Neofusicoccum parvum UCRNP2]|uniref:MARVEL domain-containing protein n=1 Tax=Botryosphaeria parva (strain UCR-NP2) TaxID=1287680 RepID=R1EI17_BOTPV|nr:hypothetical protein UCRNP2_6076 [Neofusicoccum parvum UCRNP2]